MVKKEEKVIDKKTRTRLTNEILEEINDSVKESIVQDVVKDVKDTFDIHYKEDIKEQISNEIISDVKNSIQKEQRKLSRQKSYKIFRMYIYLLVLILACLYAIYRLYVTGNLNVIIPGIEKVSPSISTTTTIPVTTKPVKDLSWYKNEYGYLLDSLHITNYEILKGSYVVSNLDITDRLAMTYKSLKTEDILNEGIIYSVTNTIMQEGYKKLFGDLAGYREVNFSVDGMNFAYSTKNETFIAVNKDTIEEEMLVHEILKITEENDMLTISTYVGLVKNNNLYNIFNLNSSLGVYKMGNDLKEMEKSLSKVDYIFEKKNNVYYISKIIKK